jgi:hypothetical protein
MARAEGLSRIFFQHPRRDDDRRREYDTPLSQGQGIWHDVRRDGKAATTVVLNGVPIAGGQKPTLSQRTDCIVDHGPSLVGGVTHCNVVHVIVKMLEG